MPFLRRLLHTPGKSPQLDNIDQTFVYFSRLPAELRDQIWKEALPDKIEAALHFYNEDCWTIRHLLQDDPDYDHVPDDVDYYISFEEKTLDPVHISIPMLNASHESRDSALKWVTEQGLCAERSSGDDKYLVVRSPFNRTQDVVYIKKDCLHHFAAQPQELLFTPELTGRLVTIHMYVQHIALGQSLLGTMYKELPEILDQNSNIKTLFVVADPQPISSKAGQRWELEAVQGGGFVWDVDQGGFRAEMEGDRVQDRQLYRVLEKICDAITAAAQTRVFDRCLAIRPVQAVER